MKANARAWTIRFIEELGKCEWMPVETARQVYGSFVPDGVALRLFRTWRSTPYQSRIKPIREESVLNVHSARRYVACKAIWAMRRNGRITISDDGIVRLGGVKAQELGR